MSEEIKAAVEAMAPESPAVPLATTVIKHNACGKLITLDRAMADSHRANPTLFRTLPCHHHGHNAASSYPVGEFTWGDDTPFGSK